MVSYEACGGGGGNCVATGPGYGGLETSYEACCGGCRCVATGAGYDGLETLLKTSPAG